MRTISLPLRSVACECFSTRSQKRTSRKSSISWWPASTTIPHCFLNLWRSYSWKRLRSQLSLTCTSNCAWASLRNSTIKKTSKWTSVNCYSTDARSNSTKWCNASKPTGVKDVRPWKNLSWKMTWRKISTSQCCLSTTRTSSKCANRTKCMETWSWSLNFSSWKWYRAVL